MSGSDSDDGGPGLEGILWGNLGKDGLELDYMDEGAVNALAAVSQKVGLSSALLSEVSAPGGAAAAGGAGAGGRARSAAAAKADTRPDYEDEPTLPEDLEDEEFPVLQQAPVAAAARQQPGMAAAGAGAMARAQLLAAGAYNQQVAGEDDYDDEEEADEPAAAAAAAVAAVTARPAQPPPLQLPVQLGAAGDAAPSPASLQQLQQQYNALLQLQQTGVPLDPMQLQQLQQEISRQNQAVTAAAAAQAAAAAAAEARTPTTDQQQPARPAPKLTPEQERQRLENMASAAQEAQQEALAFKYVDLDHIGEDIIHFAELYAPTDNQIKSAYLTSFAKVPPSDNRHHDPLWDTPAQRARRRADTNLNRQFQQRSGVGLVAADGSVLPPIDPVMDDEGDKFHKGDVAVLAAEGNTVQLGLQNVRLEVVEELSEPEEELFASDPQGLGRAMIQAARINAARAAAQAAVAAAKAAAAKAAKARERAADGSGAAGEDGAAGDDEDEDGGGGAAARGMQGLTASLQGLGLRGIAANPHALDALQADVLPDWEQDVFWGSAAAPQPPPADAAAAGGVGSTGTATGLQSLQPQQQQQHQPLSQQQGFQLPPLPMQPPPPLVGGPQQSGAVGGLLGMQSASSSVAMTGLPPGMSGGSMSGLPPAGSMPPPLGMLAPAHTGLPGALSDVVLPPSGGPLGLLPGASSMSLLPSQGAQGDGPMPGHLESSGVLGVGVSSASLQDAAAAAAAGGGGGVLGFMQDPAAAAAAAAGGGGGASGGRGKKGGKKESKGPSLLIGKSRKPLDSALADLKLHRHMLRLMPSIAAAAAAAAQAEAVDAAAAAAAASGDRAAAAALPQLLAGASAQSAEAAEAEDPLKLRHVGQLMAQDLKPVLPDDGEWLNDIVWDAQDDAAAAARAAGGLPLDQQQQQQLPRSVSSLATGMGQVGLGNGSQQQQQQALVVWQGGAGGFGGAGGSSGRVAVLWDLNDPHMVFEATSTQPYSNASAMMHAAPPQQQSQIPPHLLTEKDVLLRQLAPLHISCDHLYTASDRGAGRTIATGRHSKLALDLQTVPLVPKDALTPFWHRPKSLWSSAVLLYLMEEKRLGTMQALPGPHDPFKIQPVGLNLRKGVLTTVDHGDALLQEVWEVIKGSRAYKDALAVEPLPRLRSYGPSFDFSAMDDNWRGAWLEDLKSSKISDLGFRRGPNVIVPVWTLVSPLRTKEVGVLLPPNVACRPPAAFKTPKSLSAATTGHMVLLEYMEERPLMLLQPGMGMKLTTYYRRKNDSDMHYQALQAEYSEGLSARDALPLTSTDRFDARPPWMVGTPQLLTPDDPSPFYELAPIPPGEMQFAVDTPCFRAPAAPHVASAADFLLVRLSGGNIALRELTGCVAVGQQHPSMPIWVPMSAEAVAYEKARFKVYVIRTLQHRASMPAAKARKKVAAISMQELQDSFSTMSFWSNPELVTRMLQDCGCVPIDSQPGCWTFAPTAKIPSESELRKEVTPDQAVQYEALLAGLGQRDNYCIFEGASLIWTALEAINAPPATTLRLVLDMLFPDKAGRQAAAAIEECVLNPPWAQTAAYHTALRNERNPTPMTLVGKADPTGRGRGFAYTREDAKKAKDEAVPPPGVKPQQDGAITGTDADLRRLGHKRAGDILELKFGMDPATVKDLPRWDRIDAIRRAVRDPANAAMVHADPELQQYFRHVKMTAEDTKAKMRNVAAPIFAQQMNALHERWEDDAIPDEPFHRGAEKLEAAETIDYHLGVQESARGALEAARAAGDAAAEAAAAAALADAEAQLQAARNKTGLVRGMPGTIDLNPSHRGGTGGGRTLPVAGERRIKRIISYYTANKTKVNRVIYISSRDEVNALNALYKSGDGFGQRDIGSAQGQKRSNRTLARSVKLGEPYDENWPLPQFDLPAIEPSTTNKPAGLAQDPAAAAAARGGAGSMDPAYWGGTDAAAAAAAAAAGYVGYDAYGQPMLDPWSQQQQQQMFAAQQQVVAAAPPPVPRAPKLSKKQLQKQQQAAKKAAAAAARRGRKRRKDDFDSDDEDTEVSDSQDDEVEEVWDDGGSGGEDGGSPRARQKRPRAARGASAGGTDAAAAAAGGAGAGPAPVAGGGAVGGGVGLLPVYAAPPDAAAGVADGASPRLVACLKELTVWLRKGYDAMYRHQHSKQKMAKMPDLFLNPVPPSVLPDYINFVPPERQMWLNRIKERLARNYYPSAAAMLADADMLVAAATAYHTVGHGRQASPFIISLATATVGEGRKALMAPDVAGALGYWEARVQIEVARQQGPQAFQQLFDQALPQAAELYEQTAQDLPGWHWTACEKCQKWRLVSGAVWFENNLDPHSPGSAPFTCAVNFDRPNPSCDEPTHWTGSG